MCPSASPEVFPLSNGKTIPAIGLGTFVPKQEPEVVKAAVLKALQVGYRHIDTAAAYQTEQAIGEALHEAFASGLVKREELFVTTKIFPNQLHDDEILSRVKTSLSNLRLEYLDLYLIHWPYRTKPEASFGSTNVDDYLPLDIKELWEHMEKLVELGLTKSIGVSNFYIKVLKELLSVAKIPPVVNQVELHPHWQQDKVRDFCKEKNIHVSGWSPLGSPGTPYGSSGTLDNPIMKQIAGKHGKSVPQISLRWAHELGCSALPKSFNEKRLTENFAIWDFSLTEDDHQNIRTIEQNTVLKTAHFPQFNSSPWRRVEDFWDDE